MPALLCSISASAGIVSVGVNFGGTVNSTDAAGVVPAANWNNFASFSGSANGLTGDDGSASTINLDYVSDQINNNGPAGSGVPGNDALMSQGARFISEKNYTRNNAQFELSGISGTFQDGYDLYIYLAGTNFTFMGGFGNIYLGDPYTPSPINDIPPSPTFTQAFNRPGNVAFSGFSANDNYILVSGLSGDRQVVTGQMLGGGSSFDAATVAGLQVVGDPVLAAAPEASESALAMLGLSALLTHRARRRRRS